MLILTFLVSLSFVLASLFIMASLLTSEKSMKEREKMTPFECGFSPLKKSRSPFSLRFFMITLIFLIFDMEIALVLPMGIMLEMTSSIIWVLSTSIVIMILIVGLVHEWKNGALSWV